MAIVDQSHEPQKFVHANGTEIEVTHPAQVAGLVKQGFTAVVEETPKPRKRASKPKAKEGVVSKVKSALRKKK